MGVTTAELYTVVQNKSGGTRPFSFLGSNGMRLADNETVAIPGDLRASLGAEAQNSGRRQKFDAFERALQTEVLEIHSVPAPILYDPVDDLPRSFAILGGVWGRVDPTYNATMSSSYASI